MPTEGHKILARLLSCAKHVVVSNCFFNFFHNPVYAGCLRNAEKLVLPECFTFRILQELVQGPPAPHSASESPPPLPLRSLSMGVHSTIIASFPEDLAHRCSKLTKLKIHFDLLTRPISRLQHLTAVQRIIFVPLFSHISNLMDKFIGENQQPFTQLDCIKASVPPQLADLRKVYFHEGIRIPLSAINLIAAGTASEADLALQTVPLLDALSVLSMLCVGTNSVFVNNESAAIHKIHRLLDLGADPFAVVRLRGFPMDHVWPTTFHIAVAHGHHSVVSALYSHVDPSQIERIRSAGGFTPLHQRPDSFESWKVCYDWYRSNIPGWRLDDCKNFKSQTPLASLFSSATRDPTALVNIVSYIMKVDPDIWGQEMCAATFNNIVATFAEPFRAGRLRDDMNEQIAQMLETFLVSNVKFSGNLGDLLCLALAGNFSSEFESLASNATAKDFSPVFNCVINRMGLDLQVPVGILDQLLVVVKRKKIDLSEIERVGGESVIQRCLDTQNFAFIRKLLDVGFSPLLSTNAETQNLLSKLINTFSLLSMSSRYNESEYSLLLAQFLQQYLRLNRADIAALLMESLLAEQIHDQLMQLSESSHISQTALENLSLLFFGSPSAMAFLHNPVAFDSNENDTTDMSATLLFILLWPHQLPGLEFSTRRDFVHRIVAGMSSRNSFRYTTISEVSCNQLSIFHPAAQTLIRGDAENVELVMSVLPQLVEMFEQAPAVDDFWMSNFSKDIGLVLQELSKDSAKNETAIKLLSRVEAHASRPWAKRF